MNEISLLIIWDDTLHFLKKAQKRIKDTIYELEPHDFDIEKLKTCGALIEEQLNETYIKIQEKIQEDRDKEKEKKDNGVE